MAMLIPEAWSGNPDMDEEKRAFYEYHASLMEPWDGPAAIAFTDGRVIGATLDRNGLRPGRYIVTKDDLVVLASEAGVLDVPAEDMRKKGRLQPGRMFLVDTVQKRIISDAEIKKQLAGRQPYATWLKEQQVTLDQLPEPSRVIASNPETLLRRQRAYGYSEEDLRILLAPMGATGEEPIGSMGTDVPLACLSDRPQPLFNYFKQLFAQVTNPPIDPIREEMVMSLISYIGTERNILDEAPENCHTLKLPHPILTNRDLEKLRRVSSGDLLATTLPALFRAADGELGLKRALDDLSARASHAVDSGYTLLILSDRGVDPTYAPIPSLLAMAAVHNRLVREKTRTQVALIIESGEPREVMHFALLIGYGASAINPYLAIETLHDLKRRGLLPHNVTANHAEKNFIKAINKGLLKTFSKMGISTLQSYRGAQVFEAVGLNQLAGRCLLLRHRIAHRGRGAGRAGARGADEARLRLPAADRLRDRTGRRRPLPVSRRRRVSPAESADHQQAAARGAAEQSGHLPGIHRSAGRAESPPVHAARPAATEVRQEADSAGRSGAGQGDRQAFHDRRHELRVHQQRSARDPGHRHEPPGRHVEHRRGRRRRRALQARRQRRLAPQRRQAGGQRTLRRDDKLSGERGRDADQDGAGREARRGRTIARPQGGRDHRQDAPFHSRRGPDLAAAASRHLFDRRSGATDLRLEERESAGAHRREAGLGGWRGHGCRRRLEGACRRGADLRRQRRHRRFAAQLDQARGLPWELGLAETQQVLLLNDLRSRIKVQTDGKLQTGRDVVIAALLGAEEFGFATMPLITMGCIMMRKCHLNTCSVGIATQDPVLRARFQGQPEHVVNFFFFIAEQVRQHMAKLGFRTVDEMVGRVERLEASLADAHWKAKGIDLSSILYSPTLPSRVARHKVQAQDHGLEAALDHALIAQAAPALESKTPVTGSFAIRNVHRTVGAMLGGEIARRYGSAGLPDETIHFKFQGSAGQSFGAFVPNGVTLELEGDSNDYLGKGLSGGRIIAYPPKTSSFLPEESILVGNVVLYGATTGEVFLNGIAGERFAVRNSGATAVVEGVGDHGCEYMTNGTVVVLGSTGRNFAAGMSGGRAFVFDDQGDFSSRRCNTASVDLEPLESDEDVAEVRGLLERHRELTGSPRAAWILEHWADAQSRFIKVFPHEYKRVLGIERVETVYTPPTTSSPLVAATAEVQHG